MGILDRLGKVASGFQGAIQAPFGLVKDLAVGAFTDDDEFDGFIGTLYGSITSRGGQFFGELLGPEEGVGAAFGGLPEFARAPIRTVTDPALRGLEYAGREFVREPLTAGLTAASLMQAGEGFDIGRGYEIAQTRSLGQAFALALLTKDITDEAQVAEAMGTDWYQTLSGTMDATARLFLEPDVLISGGLSSARRAGAAARTTQALAKVPGVEKLVESGMFGRSIRTAKDVEVAVNHPALGVINEQILGIRREAGLPDIVAPIPDAEPIAAIGREIRGNEWGMSRFEGGPKMSTKAQVMWLQYVDAFGEGKFSPIVDDLGRELAQDTAHHEWLQRKLTDLGAPDHVVLYRGQATGEVGLRESEFLNATASRRVAERFAADKGGEVVEIVVPREDIVGIGMGQEQELIFKQGRATMKPPPGSEVVKDPAAVDRAAARIRDLAFHDHRDGAFIARTLAESDDLKTTWGALMGHQPSIDALYGTRADVAGQISRLSGDQARIASMKRMGFELPESIKTIERSQVDAEIDQLYDIESRLTHNAQANAMVREIPRISAISERRAAIVRSDFFQASPLARPLRVAINMRPRNMVDLHDAAGDAQVARLLRKARLPLEEQDRLRGVYMAAADPTARNAALAEAEAASIRALATRRGITDQAEIDRYIEMASTGRTQAMGTIAQSRQYDGAGRAFIEDIGDDGVTQKIYLPVAATQEFNNFPMPDLDAIDEIFKRRGEEVRRFGAARAMTADAFEAYQRLWKPSVLIRVGWPIRVVGEEQLRIASQIGALTQFRNFGRSAGRYLWDRQVVERVNNATQASRRIPKSERTFGGLSKEEAAKRRGLRLGTMNIRGAEIESAFGTAETFNDVYRTLNSARSSFEAVTRTADDLRNGMRSEVMGEWQSLEPTVRGYGEAWEHAVNKQMAGDEMWRQFVEGKSIDEVRDWIETTTEGRAYLRRVKHWKGRIDDWLEIAKQTADDYLPSDELRVLALEGKARAKHLEQTIPDAAGRPVVHGAVIADVTGKTKWANRLAEVRDRAMKTLGTIPTDVLSRQPYFDHHYTAEATRLINLAADQGADLTPAFIAQVEAKARNYALGESKRLLYDLADQNELAHVLRFVSPFYSAWQEVLTRWTGITVDNPAFVARLHEAWRAPERMGIVTDENGATVNEDGSATSALGEKVEAGKDRFVNFRLLATDNAAGKVLFNDLTKHVPGVKRLENAKFNKKGANLILQGAPGVGPIVQIPLNEIAKGRPEMEDSLRWALPFGASQSTIDMLLPATLRRMKTKAGGEEDRIYANQLMRIYWDMQVDYNLNKRTEKPTYAEAKKRTNEFYNVRTIASFVSPAAPSFQSPYQPYIDRYRALKEKDPETADEIFLRDEGPEFFPLTQSLSKTMDGIPPTLEGYAARQKYVDLIEKHPELGQLIVGAEGAGEFSSAVYQSQLQKPLRPGSSDKQRKAFDFEDAQARPNERLGWAEYSKAMDIIDAERMNRGLPNLQVRAATDLADLKRNVIDSLERKYPEWAEVFNVTDRGVWNRKITGMREIAADDRLAGRAEIQGLREYLEAREVVIGELRQRKAAGGASTLTAARNVDLRGLWTQVTTQLTTTNPAFSSLFYRYLERDPLDVETGEEEFT